jgi:FkbM family methyltransferase
MSIDNFNWGNTNEWYRSVIGREIFEDRIYEKFFEVEDGDVVFDAGASTGIFGYSVLDKRPSRIYCVEPSIDEIEALKENIPAEIGVYLNHGIAEIDGMTQLTEVYEGGETVSTKEFKVSKFSTILADHNIDKIDFLKTDCEGGEYEIFSIENLIWLKQNMRKAAGEWHLSTPALKQKFREFRDVFLRVFPNHEVFAVDGTNIKWDLWNENFIQYYNEVLIYIDNRK